MLKNALYQNGPWKNQYCDVNVKWIGDALNQKIDAIDWGRATLDVAPFVKTFQQRSLELWGRDFFHGLVEEMMRYLKTS